MPMAVLVTSTTPNKASWMGPTVRITTSSAPRMALNRVKTLARTIDHGGGLGPRVARLTRPARTRSATSAEDSPVGSVGDVTLGAVTLRRVPTPGPGGSPDGAHGAAGRSKGRGGGARSGSEDEPIGGARAQPL